MQNNPFTNYFDELKKKMPQETLDKYQKIGQDFFSNFDFESGYMFRMESREDRPNSILAALRSGLKAEDLSLEEIEILEKNFGNWKEKIEADSKLESP
jgi:hypothetical protein